jgi:hypothetical protein
MNARELFKSSELIQKSTLSESLRVFVMFPLGLTLLMFVKQKGLIPVNLPTYTAYEDGTKCSEKSAYKIQTPGNHPKVKTQHSEHDESFKPKKGDHFFLQLRQSI